MSYSASAYEDEGSAGAALTPEAVAHWRAEVQQFFADALAQLNGCIESLESQMHACHAHASVGMPPAHAEPTAAPRRDDEKADRRSPAPGSPTADEMHDRRLAELAQRLEAKLKGSSALRPGLKEAP